MPWIKNIGKNRIIKKDYNPLNWCGELTMDMPLLPQDFKEFLRLLNLKKVKYLLIGGYAVGFYGYPRATADIDTSDSWTVAKIVKNGEQKWEGGLPCRTKQCWLWKVRYARLLRIIRNPAGLWQYGRTAGRYGFHRISFSYHTLQLIRQFLDWKTCEYEKLKEELETYRQMLTVSQETSWKVNENRQDKIYSSKS